MGHLIKLNAFYSQRNLRVLECDLSISLDMGWTAFQANTHVQLIYVTHNGISL